MSGMSTKPLPSQYPPNSQTTGKIIPANTVQSQTAPSAHMLADIGHNSDKAGTTKYVSKSITDIEKLEEQKRALQKEILAIKKRTKNEVGVAVATLNSVLRLRKLEREAAELLLGETAYFMHAMDSQFELPLFAQKAIATSADDEDVDDEETEEDDESPEAAANLSKNKPKRAKRAPQKRSKKEK